MISVIIIEENYWVLNLFVLNYHNCTGPSLSNPMHAQCPFYHKIILYRWRYHPCIFCCFTALKPRQDCSVYSTSTKAVQSLFHSLQPPTCQPLNPTKKCVQWLVVVSTVLTLCQCPDKSIHTLFGMHHKKRVISTFLSTFRFSLHHKVEDFLGQTLFINSLFSFQK